MRVSKNAHLTRLLKVQDALLSGLVFVFAAGAGQWLDWFAFASHGNFVQLLALVIVLSAVSSLLNTPLLHGAQKVQLLIYSLRYPTVVSVGLLSLDGLTGANLVDNTLLAIYFVTLFAVLITNRVFLRWWYFYRRVEHPSNFLKILLIGAGPRAQQLAAKYKATSDWGIEIIGALDPDPDAYPSAFSFVRGMDQINNVLSANVVDEVVVCLPRRHIDEIACVVRACEEEGVCLKFMADIYDIEVDAVSLENLDGQPVLSFEPVVQGQTRLLVKRTVDLLLTIPGLLVLAPLFLLVALAIKLDSKGPVFYRQARVGLNKRMFEMIKFRSMYQDADKRQAEIAHLNEAEGPIFKIKDDPRITRVGHFIRRSSIDELPQLINVIFGHMSLVGPRPMSTVDVEQFSLGVQRRRFSVRPGLACLREISGRSELSFERWLELDLQYIREWSLWLDVKILFKLIPAVLLGKGAS